MNVTRWEIASRLRQFGLPVSFGTGGRTKWNRTRNRLPKSHTLDALCVGAVDAVASYPERGVLAGAKGRGTYRRAQPDKYGFSGSHYHPDGPSDAGHKTRRKVHYGFQTGDLVRSVVPAGKKAGVHVGSVAVRARGVFNIKTDAGLVTDVHYHHCRLIQRGDGWQWATQTEGSLDAA